jgi:drug/metabolite transporter (DMT)-like permease
MRWALAAAMGTVGYTLTDKAAAEALPRGFLSALAYDYVFFVASGLGYCLCLRLFGRPEEDARRVGWKRPALAALLNFGGYGLVLWAMQLAASAGYVLAFRQVSIVIGVVVAFRVFRERGVVIRLAAACVIFLGLALIAVYG